MKKPIFFLIATCSSFFIRIPAEIAFKEKLPLLSGDTGDYGNIAAKVGGICAIVGSTAITFFLMHSTNPNDGTHDIDYKNTLDPRRNKLIWLHLLMSLPLLATVIATEKSLPLKLTGSIPRIAMDIIIAKNIVEGTINSNQEFLHAWRNNGWLTLKFVALITIAAPLWLGLGAGTAATASTAFGFDQDSAWHTAFQVFGAAGGIPFGSTIAHASINNWSTPSEWSVPQAIGCRETSKQLIKNGFTLLFSISICAFYGLLAENGVSTLTDNNTIKNVAFAYLNLITLSFIQPAVNNIFSIAHSCIYSRSKQRVAPTVIDDDEESKMENGHQTESKQCAPSAVLPT